MIQGPVLQVYVIISFFFFCDVPSCIFPPWLLTEDILAFGNGEQASYLFPTTPFEPKIAEKGFNADREADPLFIRTMR